MKPYRYLPLLLLLISTQALAKWIPGWVYTASDSFEVTIDVPVKDLFKEVKFYKMHEGLKYKVLGKGKKVETDLEQITEVRFTYDDELVRMIPCQSEELQLLRLMVDGNTRLCTHYNYEKYYDPRIKTKYKVLVERFFVKKHDGNGYYMFDPFSPINEAATDFFKDCPELIEKHFSEGDLRDEALPFLVGEYNSLCPK